MKKKISVLILAQVAMLLAMEVILSRFFFIATPVTKFSFAFVPLAVCGALFGPVYGGIMGALADLLGATLFPIGPYFPGYTLNNALHGVALGMALKMSRSLSLSCVVSIMFLNNDKIIKYLFSFFLYTSHHASGHFKIKA